MTRNLSQCFGFHSNVCIEVQDSHGNIKKTVTKHNKCTRRMVSGILRYLCGHFTDTTNNEKPSYDSAKYYIPCYFNVGDGGVVKDSNGNYVHKTYDITIPELSSNWDTNVDYNSTQLISEFDFEASRSIIRLQDTSLLQPSVSDMDSIYFYCQISPGKLNASSSVYVTELGLFSGNVVNEQDLLAYVKLGNYDSEQKTDVLFVRPDDTIVVKWIITIASVGIDNRFEATFTDESGDIIKTDINTTHTIGNIPIQ